MQWANPPNPLHLLPSIRPPMRRPHCLCQAPTATATLAAADEDDVFLCCPSDKLTNTFMLANKGKALHKQKQLNSPKVLLKAILMR